MNNRILDSRGNPMPARRPSPNGHARPVQGRYDAAQTDDENYRHWANADSLSARSANSPDVRLKLRTRARYEAANNCYADGIVQTLASDVVGKGPQLQMQMADDGLNQRIEAAWCEWAKAVGLNAKLRTMRRVRAVDGEAFGLLASNPRLTTPAKLDIRLIEADQISTPYPWPLDPFAVDGIHFDRSWNPIAYDILRVHPGDESRYDFGFEFDRVDASLVVHWFDAKRPQQYRGIPDITPALPLFAQLRRYTLAVISAAETAADFAAVVTTPLPPDSDGEGTEGIVALDTLQISRRMMTVLPDGYQMSQFRAEQPTTTYPDFKAEILNEIARCLLMPYGVARGNYAGYNYSSGRLDHQIYYRAVGIDQESLEQTALDPLFAAWSAEMRLAVPDFDDGDDLDHRWLWPGFLHVDPAKEATAQETMLRNLMTSFSDECQKQGVDPEARAQQIAHDMALFKRYGIPTPAAWTAAPQAQPQQQQPTSPDGGGDNAGTRDDTSG